MRCARPRHSYPLLKRQDERGTRPGCLAPSAVYVRRPSDVGVSRSLFVLDSIGVPTNGWDNYIYIYIFALIGTVWGNYWEQLPGTMVQFGETTGN